ncbi:FtsK/SpoIIIE domain-containing protein [Rhizohabitans arisaemae]|uniref:FtsK/SpoIIIE domain-containing protein n=1 Tax=Rhizohabitans arisaemae TaxID=2720610 RepID=UPI0024B20405|nr:FtsK/SpoIIIE domain-containing protein [Rhizohabitans arisaemae]
MSGKVFPSKQALAEEIRDRVARALGAMEAIRARGEHRVADAETSIARSSVEAEDWSATAGEGLAPIAARLHRHAAVSSPGFASAPWARWGRTDPVDQGPCLYRVGAIQPPPLEDGPWRQRWLDNPPAALIPLLDAGNLVIRNGESAVADAVLSGLLVRMLATSQPGMIRLHVYDPVRLCEHLKAFASMAGAGLFEACSVDGFGALLGRLSDEIHRIQSTVLGRHDSLAELVQATGLRPEPWRILVVYTPVDGFRPEVVQRLQSIMTAGPTCGVHVIACDVPVKAEGNCEIIDMGPAPLVLTSSMTGPHLRVEPDAAPPGDLVRDVCERVVTHVRQGPPPSRFADLLPQTALYGQSSAAGLSAPIGDDVLEPARGQVLVELGDNPPHALVGGPSGSGKTNFLYTLIASYAARYSPDELEFYLLDFKQGVSFQQFAPGRDPSWLPHARLVGVNINRDREFGLALLSHLTGEMQRRARAAKAQDTSKLEELRQADPSGRWPRIVAIVDECQVLLERRDKITQEAVALLETLARQGRSFGIHLILASQDLSRIEALWGRSSVLEQFTLRVALPQSRRILDDDRIAERIPRFCAVVNPDSGVAHANRVVRLPNASRSVLDPLQRALWERRPDGLGPPKVFDGETVPRLADNADYARLTPTDRPPAVMVGQRIDLAGTAAATPFGRSPQRNLAVVGMNTVEACDVVAATVMSLARQKLPGTAAFTLACLDDTADAAVRAVGKSLADLGHEVETTDTWGLKDALKASADRVEAALAGERPERVHYLVLFAVDAASGVLAAKDAQTRTSGHDLLRRVLSRGPETLTHVIGWWRGVGRLREDVAGGIGGKLDDLGVWVALDVQGAELTPLLPAGTLVSWAPRERRALFFDRTRHREPQPVIPFHVVEPEAER